MSETHSSDVTHVTAIDPWTVLVIGKDLSHVNETKIEEGRAALASAAERAIADERPNLLIDMAECQFFGSSFIEALFQTWKKVSTAGGSLAVCGCNKDVKEVFEVTRLDNVWKIYANRDEAVAASPG